MIAEQGASPDGFARILAIATELAVTLSVREVAEVTLRQGIDALGAAAGNVVLVSEDGKWLEMAAATGYSDEAVEPWRRFPLSAPVALADAARSGAAVWLGSPEDYVRAYPHRVVSIESLSHPAHVALPLRHRGKPVGALGLSFGSPQRFAESDRMFLQILAQVCANNLARAQLYEAEQSARAAAEVAREQRDLFIAIAAHELRQPLTSLRGFAQVARSRVKEAPEVDVELVRTLEAIENQTERMARLITSLLDLGQIQSGALRLEVAVADLRQVVDRVVAAMERQTRAHRITARGPGYLEVTVDVARIEQVLTNLVGNAMKYSPAGQEIYIDLAQPDMETAEVAVRDHGPGIPAARLAHIFEPYYRATDGGSADGLGLGLYICRNIVLRHGGTIEAVCPEDGGTCVTVRLPIRTP